MAQVSNLDFVAIYVTVAALTCIVWDHLITLPEEIRYIWNAKKFGIYSALFLVNRYCTEAGIIFLLWYQGSAPGTSTVRTYPSQYATAHAKRGASWTRLLVENAVIAIRLYTLWERNQAAMIVLWSGFIVIYIAVLTCFAFAVKWLHAQYFLQQSVVCTLLSRPFLVAGVWGALLVFDLFMFSMFIVNALAQPYRRGSDIFGRLKRDGVLVYSVLSLMRLLNLILTLSLRPDAVFFAPVMEWGLGSAVLSRLILKVEETKVRAGADRLNVTNVYELTSTGPGTRYR